MTGPAVQFEAIDGEGRQDDHLIVQAADQGLRVAVVEASWSGFEDSSSQAAAAVTRQLATARLSDASELLVEARAAVAAIGDEASAWVVLLVVDRSELRVGWLGGLEVQLVRGERSVSRTRAHLDVGPLSPGVITRNLGTGHREYPIELAAPQPLEPGDRVIVLSHRVARTLDQATVVDAVRGGDAAASLAATARAHGVVRGFVAVIDAPLGTQGTR